jgi:hypothetical protein
VRGDFSKSLLLRKAFRRNRMNIACEIWCMGMWAFFDPDTMAWCQPLRCVLATGALHDTPVIHAIVSVTPWPVAGWQPVSADRITQNHCGSTREEHITRPTVSDDDGAACGVTPKGWGTTLKPVAWQHVTPTPYALAERSLRSASKRGPHC